MMTISSRRRRRQSGWVAIGFAMLGATAAGWLLLAAVLDRQQLHQAFATESRDQSLDWAQAAVRQFAGRHSRLPCPARTVDGPEDCSTGFKGWLPTATLNASLAGVGLGPTRYLVYRGTGAVTDPDLAGPVVDAYSPRLANHSDGGAASHLNGLDLCESVRSVRQKGRWGMDSGEFLASTARAHVQVGGRAATVAFALAVAATPGRESESPALNVSLSSPVFELGASANGAADLVRFTTFEGLSRQLRCDTAAASLDTLAIANSWAAAVDGARDANIQSGHDTGDVISSFFVTADGLGLIGTGLDLNNGHSAIAKALATIVTLTPGLPATAPKIALQKAAIASAKTGVLFAKYDLARGVVGAIADASYMAAYKIVAQQAEAIPVWHGGQQWLDTADEAGLVVSGGR